MANFAIKYIGNGINTAGLGAIGGVHIPPFAANNQVNSIDHSIFRGMAGFTAIAASAGPWVHYGAPVPYFGKLIGDASMERDNRVPLPDAVPNPYAPTPVIPSHRDDVHIRPDMPTIIVNRPISPAPIPSPSSFPLESKSEVGLAVDQDLPPINHINVPYHDKLQCWAVIIFFAVFCTAFAVQSWLKTKRTRDRICKSTPKAPTRLNKRSNTNLPLENDQGFLSISPRLLVTSLQNMNGIERLDLQLEMERWKTVAAETLSEKKALEHRLRLLYAKAILDMAPLKQQNIQLEQQAKDASYLKLRWQENFEKEQDNSLYWQFMLNNEIGKNIYTQDRLELVSTKLAVLRKEYNELFDSNDVAFQSAEFFDGLDADASLTEVSAAGLRDLRIDAVKKMQARISAPDLQHKEPLKPMIPNHELKKKLLRISQDLENMGSAPRPATQNKTLDREPVTSNHSLHKDLVKMQQDLKQKIAISVPIPVRARIC
ncbi:hypothetical protein P280DRAFT_541102 [Massarina eburnea CBS 473.64]|uniref:Uncharacterized protein n=1 Tax=Massarina eburnea CBS 473.64 TaxID=1395130 RepID=A0A6A6S695_9PLEO|nr:hypothetical protein P280DRAFT_541102 [Massarina eburnea CBS 473.64]